MSLYSIGRLSLKNSIQKLGPLLSQRRTWSDMNPGRGNKTVDSLNGTAYMTETFINRFRTHRRVSAVNAVIQMLMHIRPAVDDEAVNCLV